MSFPTGHIGINVTNLARSRDFYIDVFGLQVLGESNGEKPFAFLGKGADIVFTLWQQSKGRFDTKTPGLHHLSFVAESMDAVRATESRLKKKGVKFTYDTIVPHAEGMDSGGIYFEDPDGVRLEIFAATGAKETAAPAGELPSCGFFL
ncbi:MAG TPA: VOC family protein [Thermoanaerobaculia bacterium]|nr:VOC family protein [Thermoanaerobaculia bacterium]